MQVEIYFSSTDHLLQFTLSNKHISYVPGCCETMSLGMLFMVLNQWHAIFIAEPISIGTHEL